MCFQNEYVYKKKYDNAVGCRLRELYEGAKILSEQDFKEMLENVWLVCNMAGEI